MNNNNFQIIVVVLFIGLAVFGVLVFSGLIPLGKQKTPPGSLGTVTLWGTVKTDDMAPFIEKINETYKEFTLRYSYKAPDVFDNELIEAFASGQGPDLFFVSNELAYEYRNKIQTIPYTSFPESSYKANFASAGEVFMTKSGILAFPIAIDPLMMYYNRSILNANGVVFPPEYWDQFTEMVKKITTRDESRQLVESAVALGQVVNVKNAKNIITTLFMQTGNPIAEENDNGFFTSAISKTSGLDAVLSFYTSFADPLNENYSWNRSLPNSQDFFSAEKLAFYFGYASELGTLVNKNPNQDFLVAPIPQIKNSNFKVTHGRVLGIAVAKSSDNLNTALMVGNILASGDFAEKVARAMFVAPARRDLLNKSNTDAFYPYFYTSALFAKSWLDPDSSGSNDVFRSAIDGILSNRLRNDTAVTDINNKLQFLFSK